MDPGQGFDQGRLAGAVLAHDAMDLAGQHGEINSLEGLDGSESLREPRHFFEQRTGRFIWHHVMNLTHYVGNR